MPRQGRPGRLRHRHRRDPRQEPLAPALARRRRGAGLGLGLRWQGQWAVGCRFAIEVSEWEPVGGHRRERRGLAAITQAIDGRLGRSRSNRLLPTAHVPTHPIQATAPAEAAAFSSEACEGAAPGCSGRGPRPARSACRPRSPSSGCARSITHLGREAVEVTVGRNDQAGSIQQQRHISGPHLVLVRGSPVSRWRAATYPLSPTKISCSMSIAESPHIENVFDVHPRPRVGSPAGCEYSAFERESRIRAMGKGSSWRLAGQVDGINSVRWVRGGRGYAPARPRRAGAGSTGGCGAGGSSRPGRRSRPGPGP